MTVLSFDHAGTVDPAGFRPPPVADGDGAAEEFPRQLQIHKLPRRGDGGGGGGIGAAPLYGLAKRMLAAGRSVQVVLGFRSKEDAFYLEEFAALGAVPFQEKEPRMSRSYASANSRP